MRKINKVISIALTFMMMAGSNVCYPEETLRVPIDTKYDDMKSLLLLDSQMPYLDAFVDKLSSPNHNIRAQAVEFYNYVLHPILRPKGNIPAREYLIAKLERILKEIKASSKSFSYGVDPTSHINIVLEHLYHKEGTRSENHSYYIQGLMEEVSVSTIERGFTFKDQVDAIIGTGTINVLIQLRKALLNKLKATKREDTEIVDRLKGALNIIDEENDSMQVLIGIGSVQVDYRKITAIQKVLSIFSVSTENIIGLLENSLKNDSRILSIGAGEDPYLELVALFLGDKVSVDFIETGKGCQVLDQKIDFILEEFSDTDLDVSTVKSRINIIDKDKFKNVTEKNISYDIVTLINILDKPTIDVENIISNIGYTKLKEGASFVITAVTPAEHFDERILQLSSSIEKHFDFILQRQKIDNLRSIFSDPLKMIIDTRIYAILGKNSSTHKIDIKTRFEI